MQITSNSECMRRCGSVQRTLEQGLVVHLEYVKQPSHVGAGLPLGQPPWGEAEVAVPVAAPRSCGSAVPRASAPTAWRGDADIRYLRYLRYLTTTALTCLSCACQLSYQEVQGTPLL